MLIQAINQEIQDILKCVDHLNKIESYRHELEERRRRVDDLILTLEQEQKDITNEIISLHEPHEVVTRYISEVVEEGENTFVFPQGDRIEFVDNRWRLVEGKVKNEDI